MPRDKIPAELRTFPQWVCASTDKKPRNPRDPQRLASVTDPKTWGTFEEANAAGYPHVGFVFTDDDPFTGIDLDNKSERPLTPEQWAVHERILNAFESYTERSTSGRGYHVIVKGRVSAGVHGKDGVEVYSSERYFIVTGDIVRDAPIAECQPLLDRLLGEMKPAPTVELEEAPEDPDEVNYQDRLVVETAMNAANADKFNRLCRGEWEGEYPSQSEADYALLSILAFYSKNNEQVRRLFRMSQLGKRDKATSNDRYLNRSLAKIRAGEPPPLPQETRDAIQRAASLAIPPQPSRKTARVLPTETEYPPGLVGDVARYLRASALRPCQEIAIAAALALTSGIAGRAYNVSNTGLNQYIIILAQTGVGKDDAKTGIDRFLAKVREKVPSIRDTFIGPGAFASGQALTRRLQQQPCFLSVLGEFGLTLQLMCDSRANASLVMLRKVLLDLYTKSGKNHVLDPHVYSDAEKNMGPVPAPAVTILAESTPSTFFDGLDSSHIAEGLIPRFLVVQYPGDRAPRNRTTAGSPPPEQLVQRFADLATVVLAMENNNLIGLEVQTADQGLLDKFDDEADEHIFGATDVPRQLWTRAHLKALRVAATLAVGVDHHAPVITPNLADWAIRYVRRDVEGMVTKFSNGEVGLGDHKCLADARRAIREFQDDPVGVSAKYVRDTRPADAGIIMLNYFSKRLSAMASFRKHRLGSTAAIKMTLQQLIELGELVEVPKNELSATFKTTAKAYRVPS